MELAQCPKAMRRKRKIRFAIIPIPEDPTGNRSHKRIRLTFEETRLILKIHLKRKREEEDADNAEHQATRIRRMDFLPTLGLNMNNYRFL